MIALAFDVVIAILLVVSILFCVILCRRLKRLRADEAMMRSVVADIVQSTGKAEHAIRTLKATADECEHTLGMHLRDANVVCHDLKTKMSAAEAVARNLAQMNTIARSKAAADTKSVPAAANQLVERPLSPGSTLVTMPAAAPAPPPRRVSALEALRARAA